MRKNQILARLREIATEMETLDGLDQLTDEQTARFAELDTESQGLETELEQIEARSTRLEALRGRVAAGEVQAQRGSDELEADPFTEPESIRSGADRRGANPWREPETRSLGQLRGRALAAAERMTGASDGVRDALTRFIEASASVEDDSDPAAEPLRETLRQVMAASDPEYLKAFRKLVMLRQDSATLTQSEVAALQRTQPFVRAMSTTDANGGYLIPQQLDPNLILTANGTTNPIRDIARKVIATGDRWDGVSAGAASWSWDAEGTEVSDDAVATANPFVQIFTGRGFIPYSHEVGMDAANWAENLGLCLAQGKDDLEATAHVTGSGTGQPVGIVTALTGGSSVVASAATDTFAVGDTYSLIEALPARYRRQAKWAMNVAVIGLIRKFGTADSHALLTHLNDGHDNLQLHGKPVLEASQFDGVINATVDNFLAVVGDWSNYVIADRLGMVVEVIPHLFGANGRPTGQAGLYARFRSGADSVNDGGFRMLNVT